MTTYKKHVDRVVETHGMWRSAVAQKWSDIPNELPVQKAWKRRMEMREAGMSDAQIGEKLLDEYYVSQRAIKRKRRSK